MTNSFKSYLFAFIISLSAFCAIYIWIFNHSLGAPITAEWWVKHALDYKEYRASQIKEKKIILAGGSNLLFGIESPVIEQFTGLPVVNMATHAQLEIEYQYNLIEKHLNEGDILIISLEYEHFKREKKLYDWFARNMLAWGEEDYLSKLKLQEYLWFILHTPKELLWLANQALGEPKKLKNSNLVIKEVLQNNQRGKLKFDGYSHLSLNLYGDLLAEYPPFPRMKEIAEVSGDSYEVPTQEISPVFLEEFKRIQNLANIKGAKLYLTWPVTIRNPLFDLSQKAHQDTAKQFKKALEEHDISIYCEPGLFNLNYTMFSNTRYHLNAKGARLRSIVLGDCLRTLLSGKEPEDLDDDLVATKIKELEEQFMKMKYPLPK